MSITIYLCAPPVRHRCRCSECGDEHDTNDAEVLYQTNITHNVVDMAVLAGVYQRLWMAEENGVETASELIVPLRIALDKIRDQPAKFRKAQAKNGWGTAPQFQTWLHALLEACESHPEARIRVSK